MTEFSEFPHTDTCDGNCGSTKLQLREQADKSFPTDVSNVTEDSKLAFIPYCKLEETNNGDLTIRIFKEGMFYMVTIGESSLTKEDLLHYYKNNSKILFGIWKGLSKEQWLPDYFRGYIKLVNIHELRNYDVKGGAIYVFTRIREV